MDLLQIAAVLASFNERTFTATVKSHHHRDFNRRVPAWPFLLSSAGFLLDAPHHGRLFYYAKHLIYHSARGKRAMQPFGHYALAAAITIASTVTATTSMALADPVADFYRDKSIDLSIGFGPGGGFDLYARLLARHLGNFIPGRPTVIPRNMPGGGGLVAANYLFNVAPRDGRSLAIFGPFNAMEPLFGNAAAKFDPAQFTWIGNMNLEVEGCGAWRTSGIRTLVDLQTKMARFGSSGKASTTNRSALALRSLLGAKLTVVQGYRGSREINIAMQRGEVDAMCGISVSSAIAEWQQDMKNGESQDRRTARAEEAPILRRRRGHLRPRQNRRGP